jgi:Protein of unknown function (DUF669)
MSDELETPFEPEKEKGTSFDLLPSGKYKAEIVQATCGRTKNGRAQSVKLRWAITEGDFENRLLFQDIIVQHDESEGAQRIGREKFKDLCDACGITDPVTKLDVLLYRPCMISVTIEKDKNGEYPDKNKVARVLPVAASGNGGATARKGASEKPGNEIPWE